MDTSTPAQVRRGIRGGGGGEGKGTHGEYRGGTGGVGSVMYIPTE